MKAAWLMAIVAAVAFGAGILAGCSGQSDGQGAGQPAGRSPAPSAPSQEITQTTCPVMGGKIDKDIYVDYQGRRVYFCCPGCPEKFNEDPEKYLAKLEQESS